MKKTIPLRVAPRRRKFIGTKLTKEMEQLCSENYKLLRKGSVKNSAVTFAEMKEPVLKFP